MAKKKRSGGSRPRKRSQRPKQPTAQPWYRRIATPRLRQAKERNLREKLHTVRQLFTGFEKINARYPRQWTLKQRREVERFSYQANSLLASPNILSKPRNQRERLALQKHTGQLHPRQKRFVIHVPAPRRSAVRFVQDRIRVPFMAAAAMPQKRLRVEVIDRVKGGELYWRDYLFREVLGYQPITWDDFIDALNELLPYLPDETPSGEEATYVLLSEPHGPISSPVFKRFLLLTMQEWAEDYHDSFAGLLIGVRYQGDKFQSFDAPKSEYNERQRTRGVFKELKTEYQKSLARWNRDEFKRRLAEYREARGLSPPKKRKRIKKKKPSRRMKRKSSVKRRTPRKPK